MHFTHINLNLTELKVKTDILLLQLVGKHGLEADRHLLRCLFSCVDFGESIGSKTTTPPISAQAQLLQEQCAALLNKPTLVSTLCFAFDNPIQTANKKVGVHFL